MLTPPLSNKLHTMADPVYKEFQAKLVPTVSPDTIIGVRTPDIRRLAKELFKDPARDEFLNDLPHKYYEENLLHFFVIALFKDIDECVTHVDNFLHYVDNWAVSDQSSPQVFKKHHDRMKVEARKWVDSSHVYTARFGIRVFMNEFLDDDFSTEYLDLISQKNGDDYYLKMMVAWYFATALAKQYDATIPYIENHKLPVWTHNKAIQKALESYRVTDEHKAYLRTLKIK